ncbi:MAG TPA: penicillin-binding protein, partial [Beijerinckiaceae bacterium]|nr:penicillin-binding protein [Beijerinckiaceae bacterium]
MAEAGRRREPVLGARADASALDLRLTREDRAGGDMPKSRRPGGEKRGGRAGKRAPPSKGRGRRSILGRLVYGMVVLGIWCVIGLAGLIAYHAAQLPPIDQLAVPKRPPNIAILASDGTLLANRGETGGRTVSLKELPPHLPKAFLAIEDRRF